MERGEGVGEDDGLGLGSGIEVLLGFEIGEEEEACLSLVLEERRE